MSIQNISSTSVCGFEKDSLELIRNSLETLLSREHILDNVVIQECFNKDVMGFSLYSVSNLDELKEVGSRFLGEHSDSDNKRELMLGICIGTVMSEVLNLSVYSQDGNETNISALNPNDSRHVTEEYISALADTSKVISELLETGSEKSIFIKPILKAERTTLILRDLDNDVIEEEIFDLLNKCPHFHAEDTTTENCPDETRKLVVNLRKEVHGTWFVTLKTEDLTTRVALWLRGQKLRDHSSSQLRVGIKSEHPIASLLSVISMNKSLLPVDNRVNNLQMPGAEMGIGIPPMMVAAMHSSFPGAPPVIPTDDLDRPITLNAVTGPGPTGAHDEHMSMHKGHAMGNTGPEIGYMVNIPGYPNAAFIQTHSPPIGEIGTEAEQPQQDLGGGMQSGMDDTSNQAPEGITAPIPLMYPYHVGPPGPVNHINMYRRIPGAPNGAIIAPIVVVPGTAVPGGGVSTSPSSSPALEPSSPNMCKSEIPEFANTRSPKMNDQGRRGSRTSDLSDLGTANCSPHCSIQINSSEINTNVLVPSEIEGCMSSRAVDRISPAIGGIPQGGAPAIIHGIAPLYYGGVPGVPEIQPINLQYMGGGGHHPGSHPHIFVHGDPQFQYQHQAGIGIPGTIQGNPEGFELDQSGCNQNSESNENNGQQPVHMPPVFHSGYYHNMHYVGEDPRVVGGHGFAAGGFAFNNMGTFVPAGGGVYGGEAGYGGGFNTVPPGNLGNQTKPFWSKSPTNNNGTVNGRFKFNGRKNNGGMGGRGGSKASLNSYSSRRGSRPKSYVNEDCPGVQNSEGAEELKIEVASSHSPGNAAPTKNSETGQYEHGEAPSSDNSRQSPSNNREISESSVSEGATKIYSVGAVDEGTRTTHFEANKEGQVSKKPSANSSTASTYEFPNKHQTLNKNSKPFNNAGGKSKNHRNGKKIIGGAAGSGGKGNFEQYEYQSGTNSGKSKAPAGSGGSSANPQSGHLGAVETEASAGERHKRRQFKQVHAVGGGGDGGEHFHQGKYGVYENNYSRSKRASGSEKYSGSYLSCSGHRGKGHAFRGNDQEVKKMGLDNFPSLSDAMSTRK